MPIEGASAHAAVARLAVPLGLDVMATAQGIVSVVTANMARAIRVVSVQRGYDPHDYTLLAFGGAGPLHATRLARELEISRVLVPRNPGTLRALGLLLTDLQSNFARTRHLRLDGEAPAAIAETFAGLDAQAMAWFGREGIAPAARSLRRAAFKVPGGLVTMDDLKRREPNVRGIIGATRGNHGQSLALAPRRSPSARPRWRRIRPRRGSSSSTAARSPATAATTKPWSGTARRPVGDPRRRAFHTQIGQIAADQIPPGSGIMRR